MTPQERDLLIAKAMGLENVRKIRKWIKYNNGLIDVVWNPSENAKQREMIEDWLIKQGYLIGMSRRANKTWYTIYTLRKDHVGANKFKSEAFLEAIRELCLTLKNQK